MRTCNVCKELKPLEMFFKDKNRAEGRTYRCKDCERLQRREQRKNNIETFIRKDRNYYINNKEKIRLARIAWYKKNKHKQSAHEKVKRALLNGTLIRPSKCEQCENTKLVAHHEDYSKPLDVNWLCQTCHMRLHHGY